MRSKLFTLTLALAALLATSLHNAQANGLFITGHDADFHATPNINDPLRNTAGAQHIIQKAIKYVTNNKVNPTILLVTDVREPGNVLNSGNWGQSSDPRLGLQNAGYATFDVADDGSAGGAVKDLHTVNFNAYDAVIIASDFGGWLRQSELDILNTRTNAITSYVNNGGGLVVFPESGERMFGVDFGTDHGRFGFLPFLTGTSSLSQFESGFTLTPDGTALGLTTSDINDDFSHCYFTNFGNLTVIDRDSNGRVITLATKGSIGPSGGPTITNCGVNDDSLWPPNHDLVNVGLHFTLSQGSMAQVTVYSNEGDLGPDGDDNFSPDAKNFGAGTLRLRSERPGQSDGRVYLIVITATDLFGQSTSCALTVGVPHDQSKASKNKLSQLSAAAVTYFNSFGTPPPDYVQVGGGPTKGPKQ